jgi:hypothetical protein
MADNLRSLEERIDTDRSKWNTGFHICGNHNAIEKEILRKAGKYSDLFWQQNNDGFGTLSLNGRVERDELQCHRVKIDVGFD